MTLYVRLRELLAQGFFPDNFLRIAQLAEEASFQADSPLGLYTLARTLHSLYGDWADSSEAGPQGIRTESAEAMTALMEPPIRAYLDAFSEDRISPEDEVRLLDNVVKSFLTWRTSDAYNTKLRGP
jgi:hypothetical protein